MISSNRSAVEQATKTLTRLRSAGNTTLDSVQTIRAELRRSHSDDEVENIIRDVLDEDRKY